MSDIPTPEPPANPAPKPAIPPELLKKKAKQLHPEQSKIHKGQHKGMVADVLDELNKGPLADHLKASINAELKASGAKAAVVDIHRHEIQTDSGKKIVIHATISPLF